MHKPIRNIRELLGLSQRDLALALRVSKRTIARWEAGGSVHPVYLDRMEQMLKTDPVMPQEEVPSDGQPQT